MTKLATDNNLTHDEEVEALMEEYGMSELGTPQETTELNYDGGLPPYMENM